jgi:nucleotide-binding universal stress UspA family protein
MKSWRRIVVAVDFSDQLTELLKPISDMDFLAESEIQFVHVYRTITFSYGIGKGIMVYPVEFDRKVIEQSGLALLASAAQLVLPKNFEGKLRSRLFFSEDPKRRFSQYVNEEQTDLVIVPTRKKHGFFESSFAQFVSKHTTCDMIMLKHRG